MESVLDVVQLEGKGGFGWFFKYQSYELCLDIMGTAIYAGRVMHQRFPRELESPTTRCNGCRAQSLGEANNDPALAATVSQSTTLFIYIMPGSHVEKKDSHGWACTDSSEPLGCGLKNKGGI